MSVNEVNVQFLPIIEGSRFVLLTFMHKVMMYVLIQLS